jgi:hypothetical protein
MTDLIKRPLFTEAGEPLLLPRPPLEAARRWAQFQEAFGLTAAEAILSPLVSIPLPKYLTEWPAGRRRWAGTPPTAMWHPLMWLPPRLASRAILETDPGTGEPTEVETRALWSVRVMLELTFAGFYDISTGAWVDVLSLTGIGDIADADLAARVGRWLDGAPDPALDAIDLSSYFKVEGDEWWSLDSADQLSDALWVISWGLSARELGEVIDEIDQAPEPVDLLSLNAILGLVISTATTAFTYVPLAEDAGDEHETEEEFWTGMATRLEQADLTDPDTAADIIAEINIRLQALRETYEPEIDNYLAQALRAEQELGTPATALAPLLNATG